MSRQRRAARRTVRARIRSLVALTAFGAWAGTPGCEIASDVSVPSAERRPHLFLILIDTLRADHLGAYGYGRDTSPNIDALAALGTTFTQASAPSPWTKPSVASLFTSLYPSEHGAVSSARDLAAEVPTLAERLRSAGYETVGVSGNFVHVTEPRGFARGFERWKTVRFEAEPAAGEPLLEVAVADGRTVRLRAPSADELNREIRGMLPARAEARPLFLYVHYMDPHSSYAPPPRHRDRFRRDPAVHRSAPEASTEYLLSLAREHAGVAASERERLIDLYDGEIAAADEAVGELLEMLEARGFRENAVIVLVSDHGEEFGEHGGWFHGRTLHEESLRVPLVIADTRAPQQAARRDAPVDLLDVPTTLLGLAGLEPPPGMRGRFLLGDAGALAERALLAELHPDPLVEERLGTRVHEWAVLAWPWKLLVGRDGTRVAYHKLRDRGEQQPLAPVAAPLPEDLVARVEAVRAEASSRAATGAQGDPDPETLEALRALGYAR